jgi:hypothetical protein
VTPTADSNAVVQYELPATAAKSAFPARCHVSVAPVRKGAQTAALADKITNEARILPNAKVSTPVTTTLGSEPARRVEIEYTMSNIKLKMLWIALIRGEEEYRIGLAGDPARFDQLVPAAEEIAKSWRWITAMEPTTSPAKGAAPHGGR